MKDIIIETERLRIVPSGPQYLAAVHAYAADRENTAYMLFLPNREIQETAVFLERVAQEWQKDSPAFFEFALLYEGQPIGAVSVDLEGGAAELGWILHKAYWGQGFAYEAAAAVVQYFAERRGITHFIAHCDTQNTASYRLMEKLGMVRTGESGGRRNHGGDEESREYQYELIL